MTHDVTQPASPTPPEARVRNRASLDAVPRDVLPECAARAVLLHLVARGYDVYAYHAGTWYVWIEPLARVTGNRDGRVPIALWLQAWQWITPAIYHALTCIQPDRTERGTLGHGDAQPSALEEREGGQA